MVTLKNGYVINADSYWRPAYRISPFNTGYVSKNKRIISAGTIDKKDFSRFFGNHFYPCVNGRTAIKLALRQYHLQAEDEVWIVTTSGNKYISSCVTGEIDQVCRWSMNRSPKTKLIFVNHEFGFCHTQLQQLKKEGLPIIEDRALSFLSNSYSGDVGTVGDFVIYSLPKFFPVSFGGVLQCNDIDKLKHPPVVDPDLDHVFSVLMSYYLPKADAIKKARLENYNYLAALFSKDGYNPFFEASAYEVPGAFMFRTDHIALDKLKIFMHRNGIESSVFYGEKAFYIPVHQELTREDLDFFHLLVSHFSKNGDQ